MRKIPLFSALDESELQRLLRLCPVKTLPAGSRIFSPLQRAENFYVILAGEVKLCKLSARGDEQILHLYGPGRAFGEAAMLAGIDYPAFAETLTDATLLTVGRKAIKELIDTHSDIAMAMLAGMSAKLREFNLLIEQLSLKEVPARLAGVLLKLAGQTDGNVIRLPQTKRQLASQIGTTAETLSRAFAKIKTMKLIEVDSRQITILDIEGLTDLATD